jgi:hypothetical protein
VVTGESGCEKTAFSHNLIHPRHEGVGVLRLALYILSVTAGRFATKKLSTIRGILYW